MNLRLLAEELARRKAQQALERKTAQVCLGLLYSDGGKYVLRGFPYVLGVQGVCDGTGLGDGFRASEGADGFASGPGVRGQVSAGIVYARLGSSRVTSSMPKL